MRSWMIGVVAGILPVALLPALPGLSVVSAIALISLLLLRASLPGAILPGAILPGAKLLSGMAMGCAVAMYHGHQVLATRLPEACNGERATLTGHVSSLPRRSNMEDGARRQRFEFRVHTAAPAHCAKPVRVLISYYGPETIRPGQHWRFEARVKRPWGLANPGSFNMQAWFSQSGIDAVGSVSPRGARLLGHERDLLDGINRLRLAISAEIAALPLSAGARAILQAVTVADKSGIDADLWMLMQHLGINHLLVISGLHVGLVAGAGYLLGGFAGRVLQAAGWRLLWLAPATALSLASLYTAMAGFSVATQRALVMLACFIVARLAGRSSGSVNNLVLAALLVLMINPLAGLGSGFWLSFAAAGALIWLARWRRGPSLVWRLLGTHVFMSLVMVPLGGWWFGGSSLVAAPVNLLMVPLVGMFVVPVALAGSLGFLVGLSFASELWQLAAWPLEHLLPVVREASERAGPWIYYRHTPGPAQLALALIAVAAMVLPSAARVKATASLLLLPLLLPGGPSRGISDTGTRVAVLDVGQGTSIVVQAGHRALLYDTGGGDPAGANMARSVVLPYLQLRGITELDTLVVSHGDRDHSAGTLSILETLPVGRLRYGGAVRGISRGLPCRTGEAWRWPGGQRFQFYSPSGSAGLSSNNASCVLRVEAAGHILLIPGDIEAVRERELVGYWGGDLRSDWLHAAHHGSLTSSSLTWLKHVAPDTVVISSGNANRFGHPHPAVLDRLEKAGARSWLTALEGALEFEFRQGEDPLLTPYRQHKRRFWM